MKRLSICAVLVLITITTALSIIVPGMSINATAAEECTWGGIKCCFADPPCGTCCPRPKDGPEVEVTDWLPTILRAAALWTIAA